jgi:DNA-binding NarL/FixJ family response regulator
MTAIRVLLVDDHRSVLWGLRKLVESAGPPFELAATAGSAAEALAAAVQQRPDVILLDLDLGEGSDVELVSRLRGACSARILILTGMRDPGLQQRAAMAGASGLVQKAIRHVHAGELWLDRATVGRVFASIADGNGRVGAAAPHESLTPAERRVVLEVLRRKSAPNKVIADALHISAHTLRNHLASIYGKLGLKRRLDLVLYALERRLDRSSA